MLRINEPAEASDIHDDQDPTPPGDVLGHCYERQTRMRKVMETRPLKQREVGTFTIYSSLLCPELAEPPPVRAPEVM